MKKETEIKIQEVVYNNSKICNSCKEELPEILDRGICPYCGRKG